MNVGESNQKRVSIDVAAEHVPELLETLGSFIASHNLRIEFGQSQAKEAEAVRYNPDKVEWFTDAFGRRVPLVTKHGLKKFERQMASSETETYKYTGRAERVFNGARRNVTYGDGIVLPYVLVEGNNVRGFLADRLLELAEQLHDDTIDIPNNGVKSGEFLIDFCQDLVLPENNQ